MKLKNLTKKIRFIYQSNVFFCEPKVNSFTHKKYLSCLKPNFALINEVIMFIVRKKRNIYNIKYCMFMKKSNKTKVLLKHTISDKTPFLPKMMFHFSKIAVSLRVKQCMTK